MSYRLTIQLQLLCLAPLRCQPEKSAASIKRFIYRPSTQLLQGREMTFDLPAVHLKRDFNSFELEGIIARKQVPLSERLTLCRQWRVSPGESCPPHL